MFEIQAYCSGQPKVANGHNAAENQVSNTSSSCRNIKSCGIIYIFRDTSFHHDRHKLLI